MGSFATSGTTTKSSSPFAAPLAGMAGSEWKIAKPLLQQIGSQYSEALRTGGVDSFIPWISRALDASRSAGSTSLDQLRQKLATMGMGGSSEAAALEGRASMSNAGNLATTPEEMIMNFISGAPGFALNTAGQAQRGWGMAGSFDNTTHQTSTPSLFDQFMQGVQGANSIARFGMDPSSSGASGGSGPPSGSPVSTQDQFSAGDSTGMGAGSFAGSTWGPSSASSSGGFMSMFGGGA